MFEYLYALKMLFLVKGFFVQRKYIPLGNKCIPCFCADDN
jgi:hypothetical protein